jgi:hypothetical protein
MAFWIKISICQLQEAHTTNSEQINLSLLYLEKILFDLLVSKAKFIDVLRAGRACCPVRFNSNIINE